MRRAVKQDPWQFNEALQTGEEGRTGVVRERVKDRQAHDPALRAIDEEV